MSYKTEQRMQTKLSLIMRNKKQKMLRNVCTMERMWMHLLLLDVYACWLFALSVCLLSLPIAAAPEECVILIYTNVNGNPSIMPEGGGTCPEDGGKRAFVLDMKGSSNRQPKLIEASPSKNQIFRCLPNMLCMVTVVGYGLSSGDFIYIAESANTCPPKHISNHDYLQKASKIIKPSIWTVFGSGTSSMFNSTIVTVFEISPILSGEYTVCYSPNLAVRDAIPEASDLHYSAGSLIVESDLMMYCDFEDEDKICGFKIFNDDSRVLDLPWLIHSGSSSTPGTGPSYDHTRGEDNVGHYLYMKSPGFAPGATATLLSPLFLYPLGHYCVKLFYHMYGDDVNSIRAYVRTVKDNFVERRNWGKPSFVRIADHGNEWHAGGFEFESDGVEVQQIIIEGLAGYSEKGDLAIDDLSISPGRCPSDLPLKDYNKDFICGEVRLNTGNWSEDKSWYLEGAVSCAGRGYSYKQLQGSWAPCCVPNYGNYTVVLKDRYGDGWNGSEVEFRFFNEIIKFGDDFVNSVGSEKKYNLVVGLLQISRVEGKKDSIALEVTVMIADAYVWCGAVLQGFPPPTAATLKSYGIRSKEKTDTAGDKIRLAIKNGDDGHLLLWPQRNYEVYCYAEDITQRVSLAEGNSSGNNPLKMDDSQIVSSKVLVTTDGEPPVLDVIVVQPEMYKATVTFSMDKGGTVWCYAAENTSTNEDGIKQTTTAEIKANGQKAKLQQIDVYTTHQIVIKKLMPDTPYSILCYAEDLANPQPNCMSADDVQRNLKIITTQAKVPKLTIESYKTFARGFTIMVRVDAPSNVWCGAAIAGSPYPTKEDVRSVGATAKIDDIKKVAELELRGVPQNTRYTVYCFASSRNGNMEMSESDMWETALEVTSFGKFCELPTEPREITDGEQTPFDPLTSTEEFTVREYMMSRRELGLDSIYRINLFVDKKYVTRYLDHGGPFPLRYARVRVGVCNMGQGLYKQYKVGPINSDNSRDMTYEEIGTAVATECGGYSPQGIFGRRLLDTPYEDELNNLLQESFGYSFDAKECQSKESSKTCLEFGPVVYETHNDTLKHSQTWTGLRTPDGIIVPFYFIFKTANVDMSELFKKDLRTHFSDHLREIDAYWYNGDTFSTLGELLEAYRNKKLNLVTPESLIELQMEKERKSIKEKEVTIAARRLAASLPGPNPNGRVGLEYRAAPEHIEPQGKRFTVKASPGKDCYTISYSGWKMTVNNDRDTSLRLWNVKFNGMRVAFEMGLMEALAHYSIAERNWFFLDSWYGGLGSAARKLHPGIECARTGILLFLDESLCVFEQDLAKPLRAHWKAGELRDGAPHLALVLRQMLTVSNYDYVTDYVFYLTGAFEGTVSFTGELYAGVEIPWFSTRQGSFGTQVTPSLRMGALHNHLAVWKIDIDVGGNSENNSIMWKEVVKDPLRYGAHKLSTWFAETEDQAAWRFNGTRALHYFVVNEDHRIYGNPGGYLVKPQATIHIPQAEFELYQGPASWTKYRLFSSVRKDYELEATLPRDNKYPSKPAVDVDSYIENNEPIRRRDVVTWISDGIWHIPLVEDMPLTTCLGNTLGWLVKPANFFVEDPSMDLHNAIAGDVQDPGICALMRTDIHRGY